MFYFNKMKGIIKIVSTAGALLLVLTINLIKNIHNLTLI